MGIARVRYLMEVFKKKYGVVGKVGSMYLAAGFSVEFMHPTKYGPIHVVARGGGRVFAIEVVEDPSKETIEDVKTFVEKAKLVRAKPILVLYTDNAKLPTEVYKFCIENGVKVRIIRPSEIVI